MNFIVIPNSNPGGRDLKRQTNNNGVNLSPNFVVLTEPECRGLIDALHRWRVKRQFDSIHRPISNL